MLDWLTDAVQSEGPISAWVLVMRLVLALGFGVVVAGVYGITHGRNKADAPVMRATLVLLAVLIAMVSLVIGDSVPRAFSLVGALSIVRFRTVVDDTRDTAFVIFAVIVGMAVGVGQYLVPVLGVPVVTVAALIFYRRNGNVVAESAAYPECTLSIRIGLGRSLEGWLDEILARYADQFHPVSSATARQGAAVDVAYALRLKPQADMTRLVAELNQIEGIQSVELRRT